MRSRSAIRAGGPSAGRRGWTGRWRACVPHGRRRLRARVWPPGCRSRRRSPGLRRRGRCARGSAAGASRRRARGRARRARRAGPSGPSGCRRRRATSVPSSPCEQVGVDEVGGGRRDAPDAVGDLHRCHGIPSCRGRPAPRGYGGSYPVDEDRGDPSRRRVTASSRKASGAGPRQRHRTRRQHPPGPARHGGRRPPRAGHRQGRVLQPGRLGQGPDRPGHDRGGRGLRGAPARRHDRRADVGQHRRRARHRGAAPWVLVRVRLPRQGGPRQDRRAACLRRPGRGLPDGGRPGGPAQLLQRERPAGPRDPGRLEARPVLQPREPGRPLRDHRSRRSGRRPRGGSRTSSRAWAPAARSAASGAT